MVAAVAIFLGGYSALKVVAVSFLAKKFSTPPAKMFRNTFGNLTPTSVTNLQGFGEGHLGSTSHFRFEASPEDFELLIKRGGWLQTSWDLVKDKFKLEESDAKRFVPVWDPESCVTKEVYSQRDVNSDSGNTFLLLDRTTGTMYCFGFTF